MTLLAPLLTSSDFFLAPICFVVVWMLFSIVVKKYKDETIKRLFLKAFYYKMAFTLVFAIVNSYYYRGGDTEMYFNCAKYLNNAVMDDSDNFFKIFQTKGITVKSPLMYYFIFTDPKYPVFEAMHDAGNFLIPKLALPFTLIFGKSYICASMFFSFFAFGGAIRLFKFFYHYFPQYWREIALATLFLPSIAYWSSGVMKDSVCFGAVGYIIYAFLNIFIKRKAIAYSIIWIAVSGVLLFYIKVYILLALSPGIVIWLFSEINKKVENKTLRRIMGILTFGIGSVLAILLVNYATSSESLQAFRLDALVETSSFNRSVYENIAARNEGAYYSIGSSNPVLLIVNGIIATLFRPFLWEVNGPTALLSAMEALFFFYFTIAVMYKSGFISFFKRAFSHPVFIMCFIFSFVFAAAIGSTALNFGSLSRYKIPCLPFYLIMVMIMFRQAGMTYPAWLRKILGYRVYNMPKRKLAF